MKGLLAIKICIFSVMLFLSQMSLSQSIDESLEQVYAFEQVNINQADAKTIALMLNGIGESRAEAIVAYREENGLFESVDDLLQVKGVGEMTMLKNENIIIFK